MCRFPIPSASETAARTSNTDAGESDFFATAKIVNSPAYRSSEVFRLEIGRKGRFFMSEQIHSPDTHERSKYRVNIEGQECPWPSGTITTEQIARLGAPRQTFKQSS